MWGGRAAWQCQSGAEKRYACPEFAALLSEVMREPHLAQKFAPGTIGLPHFAQNLACGLGEPSGCAGTFGEEEPEGFG